MTRSLLLTTVATLLLVLAQAAAAATPGTAASQPAFPDAQGWAAHAPGGRGGKILRVTTLAADGPGNERVPVTAG